MQLDSKLLIIFFTGIALLLTACSTDVRVLPAQITGSTYEEVYRNYLALHMSDDEIANLSASYFNASDPCRYEREVATRAEDCIKTMLQNDFAEINDVKRFAFMYSLYRKYLNDEDVCEMTAASDLSTLDAANLVQVKTQLGACPDEIKTIDSALAKKYTSGVISITNLQDAFTSACKTCSRSDTDIFSALFERAFIDEENFTIPDTFCTAVHTKNCEGLPDVMQSDEPFGRFFCQALTGTGCAYLQKDQLASGNTNLFYELCTSTGDRSQLVTFFCGDAQ